MPQANFRLASHCCQNCCLATEQGLPRMDNSGPSAQRTDGHQTVLDDVPTPTDQKVGGSSPSERAASTQVRARFCSTLDRSACAEGPVSLTISHGHSRSRSRSLGDLVN